MADRFTSATLGGTFGSGAKGFGFVDGRPLFGSFGDSFLGFGAEEEAVHFVAELVVSPDAGGGLEDFDDFFGIGLQRVDGSDA